jgi:dienelactone hydrolase
MRLAGLSLALVVLLVAGPGVSRSFTETPSPNLRVTPEAGLLDESISIRASGLLAFEQVTLQATAVDTANRTWRSTATFVADQNGELDPAVRPSFQGSYTGVDAMGLFWSMQPELEPSGNDRPGGVVPFARPTSGSFRVRIELTRESGQMAASGETERLITAPGVRVTEVREAGLTGRLYEPAGAGRHPAVVVLPGSSGGVPNFIAPTLASRGYAVLLLGYFNAQGRPPNLIEIPLEYFARAFAWLKSRPSVAPGKLAVLGISRGGELALLLGATFPEVNAVVAHVPSHVVWEGVDARARVGGDGRFAAPGKSAWTYHGQPLPFVRKTVAPDRLTRYPLASIDMMNPAARPADEISRAAIPVERTRGPILLTSGTGDLVWPSTTMAEAVVERLRRNKYRFKFEHLRYPHAGHAFFWEPNMPTYSTYPLGGTAEINAHAAADCWPKVLRFLAQSLR